MTKENLIILTSKDLLKLRPGQEKDNAEIYDFAITSTITEEASHIIYLRDDKSVKVLKDKFDLFSRPYDSITQDVLEELASAEAKHSWEGNSLEKNGLILAEEQGEVAQAILNYGEGRSTIAHIRKEIIQTAAVCYRLHKNLPDV